MRFFEICEKYKVRVIFQAEDPIVEIQPCVLHIDPIVRATHIGHVAGIIYGHVFAKTKEFMVWGPEKVASYFWFASRVLFRSDGTWGRPSMLDGEKRRLYDTRLDGGLRNAFLTAFSAMPIFLVSSLRSKEEQESLVKEGRSKTLNSLHLTGEAIDVTYFATGGPVFDPNKSEDKKLAYARIAFAAGVVRGICSVNGIRTRWGGDWNDNGVPIIDQTFNDLFHVEIA